MNNFTIIFPSGVVDYLFAVSFETLKSAHIKCICRVALRIRSLELVVVDYLLLCFTR